MPLRHSTTHSVGQDTTHRITTHRQLTERRLDPNISSNCQCCLNELWLSRKSRLHRAKSEVGTSLRPFDFPLQRTAHGCAASCAGASYNSDNEGFGPVADTFVNDRSQLSPQQAAQVYTRENQRMDGSGNFTLALNNQFMGAMMQTFMACQKCTEIVSKSKQLRCSHTICQRCAYQIRTRHHESGQSMIRCRVCNVVTTWPGSGLDYLPDNGTMQKVLDKTKRRQRRKTVGAAQNGQITMYGERDLTINIVSFAKEKSEIQKVLKSAQTKIQLCHEQTLQVKQYEKNVKKARAALQKQIKQSTSMYISAIQAQQDQLLEELDLLLDDDFQPTEKAKHAIEVQMQSLKLVIQCCSVAGRILQNGGAPLDLDNFKKMVLETMEKTKAGKLPSTIQKSYNCEISFKSQKSIYKSLAGQIGCLETNRPDPDKEISIEPPTHNDLTYKMEDVSLSDDDEPIYDLPPDAERKGAQVEKSDVADETEECLYDEIPFHDTKENKTLESEDSADLPLPPPPSFLINNLGCETLNRATALVSQRRRAINGSESDASNSDDSFSSDSFCSRTSPTDSQEQPHYAHQNHPGAVRGRPVSPVSSAVSTASFRTGVDPSQLYGRPRRNSVTTDRCREQPIGTTGGRNQKLKRYKSFHSPSPLSTHMAGDEGTAMNKMSHKLLFCIGKVKKRGSDKDIQQFASTPEMAVGSDDRIWITDANNHRIQIHEGMNGTNAGAFKMMIHGTSVKPKAITILPSGNEVAVTCGKFITVWHERGELVRQIGPHSHFGKLGGIAADSDGELVVFDTENGKIIFTSNGRQISNVSPNPGNQGKSAALGRIAINGLGDIIVPDYGTHSVKIYGHNGTLVHEFGSFGVGEEQFRYPSAVATDKYNRIYVADECNNRVSMFSTTGDFLACLLTKDDGLTFPKAISLLCDNRIAVVDDSKVVKVFSFAN